MIHKYKKIISYLFLFSIVLFSMNACSPIEEDAYKAFVKDGEIQYRGKFDSIQIFPGKNRVQLNALVNSDPRVTSYRVYWANRNDSIVFPITTNQVAANISQIIENLEENTYNFEIVTYDDAGNASIPVFSIGKVFGERYESSLINRLLVKNDLQVADNSAVVQFAPVDTSTGIINSELEFTDNNNVTKTFTIPADSTYQLVLENFDPGNTFKYRSSYKPAPTSIDIFYTEYDVVEATVPITEAPYFENASAPFRLLETGGGRYATPTDWIHNDGALNHNGYGVLDTQGGLDRFNLVSGYGGEPNIVNGKIYQKMRLPSGTYTYSLTTEANNYNGLNDQVYMTAAFGDTLPDVVDVEISSQTLAFSRISGAARTYSIGFTLTDDLTDIAIGIALTNGINPNDPTAPPTNINRFMTINNFTLKKD